MLLVGVSMVLRGSGSAESDAVITCQLVRLGTPKARATEPSRGPNLRLVYTRPPCVLRGREREERPAARRETVSDVKKVHLVHRHTSYHIPGSR